MNIEIIHVGPHPTACYLVSSKNKNTVIIDPGSNPEGIIQIIESKELSPKVILLTHGHYDHIEAVNSLCKKYEITIYLCEKELSVINNTELQSLIAGHQVAKVAADKLIKDGEIITLDELSFKVLETPGHSPGSVSFLVDDILFSGDTLFADGGIGRTDLFMGSTTDISNSIRNKLFTLPVNTVVYPGHGNSSTIGKEIAIHKAYSGF